MDDQHRNALVPPAGQDDALGDPPGYEDLEIDLVELHGGGWDLIDPPPDFEAALEGANFDEADLQRWCDDRDDGPENPGEGAAMLDRLPVLQSAVSALHEDGLLLLRN